MELEAVQTVALDVAGERLPGDVLRRIVERPRGLPARRRARPHLADAPRRHLVHLPHMPGAVGIRRAAIATTAASLEPTEPERPLWRHDERRRRTLEPAAQQIADASSKPPFLYELGVAGARKILDDLQAAPIDKPDVAEEWITVRAEEGDGRVRIVKPVAAPARLPAILYVHGGGWVLGNAATHDRLVREFAVGAEAAVVFVEYDRSPEARHSVARSRPGHGSRDGCDRSGDPRPAQGVPELAK